MFSLSLFAGSAAGTLVDARFRGVRFDCLRSVDSAQRDHALHEYPYVQGADVEDLGRKARKVSLSAIFWGADYQQRLRQFVAALDESGPGELVHPVFGSMQQAQLIDYQINHEADAPDSCTVEINWIEATPGNPFFASQKSSQQIDIIGSLVDKVRALGGDAFLKVQALFETGTGALSRINAFREQMAQTAQQLGRLAQQGVNQVRELLAVPQVFIAEVTSTIDKIANWSFTLDAELWPNARIGAKVGFSNATLADWNALRERLTGVSKRIQAVDQVLAGSSNSASLRKEWQLDQQRIAVLIELNAATSLAQAAAGVFQRESSQPTLTPPGVEQIAADVRNSLQACIDQWRNCMPTADSYAVIESLRELALQIQNGAAGLIATKPPLITRRVEAASNLRQLAHLWYGDGQRADELLRLNPQLKYPNMLAAGEVINAYAN
ncbi:DNA circularization N-terminal domain-containing protein [Neisseriaceae bacterium TC5R-5]|nr:DNA circularization N-terminal domain-containing protein [Neisseriaceae bacterium TC5R-5]